MSAEDQIRQFAERIVRLEEERKALAADIKDVKAEAKAAGFSPKLIATCVRIMLMEAEKRAEALSGHEELDLCLGAVGLIARHDGDQNAPRQEEFAGHPALDRRPASNPGDGHVDRSAGARPGNEAWESSATPARPPGQNADLCRSTTFDQASGQDSGSDVELVAQVSRNGASDLDPGAFGVPRSRIHPLPATGRDEGRHLHSAARS